MSLKLANQEIELPVWSNISWPLWSRFDEMFRDGEWRRPFKIEECHEKGEMVVRAELPGVDPDKGVKVEVIDDELVITAEKSESHVNDEKHVHRSEFRYGSLTRSIPIPKGVDASKISATYKDGVLEVRMVMPNEHTDESVKQIEVKRI
jgi:HSP20 family protein